MAALLLLLALVDEPALRLELLEMEKIDQGPLRNVSPSSPTKQDWDRINAIRAAHSERLKQIVDQYGWPGKRLVGSDGANAAWLLIQHADHDVPFQERCLRLMEPAVKSGDVSATDFAYLTDRVLRNQGRNQIYGTQLTSGTNGKLYVQPVEDPKNLDRRRKSVGLMSERKYIRISEKMEREGTRDKRKK